MTGSTPTVALLGTGTMGAGLPVRVWNRSRDRAEPLADMAATWLGH